MSYSIFYHDQRYHGSYVVDHHNASNINIRNARADVWSMAAIRLPIIGGQASFYSAIKWFQKSGRITFPDFFT